MKKMLMAIAAALAISSAQAQEITAQDIDSTYIYNALNNPNDYSQAPTTLPRQKVPGQRISSRVSLGTSVSSTGSSQYINPAVSFQATDKLQLTFGMGLIYSNLKLHNFEKELAADGLINSHALTNYYTLQASYQVSSKCTMYGSLIYAHNSMEKEALPPYFSKDRYMAAFGATFNITESLSIGFEVRRSSNMGAYYGFESPYSMYGL